MWAREASRRAASVLRTPRRSNHARRCVHTGQAAMQQGAGAGAEPTVRVQQGVLRGRRATAKFGGAYFSFQGVPYARPPLGDLRFDRGVVDQSAMGAARAAAVVLVAAAAQLVPTTRSLSTMPPYIANVPTLDRGHEDMLLVKLECTQYCKNVFWQYKVAGESAWKTADAEVHSEFHSQYFFVNHLRPDTLYVLRALLKPSFGSAYAGDEIPTLEARTCPEQPPPVENLRAHSAGPGWLELRWSPAKEPCKSRLYYQARYSVLNTTPDTWIDLGQYASNHWVFFRPTHPCAVWPREFCALFTDFVEAGEQHVIEVRVSRFGESAAAVSASRRLVVRADTACIVTNSCGVIGAAPPSNASVLRATDDATDDVDLDDSDLTSTPATLPAVNTTTPTTPMTTTSIRTPIPTATPPTKPTPTPPTPPTPTPPKPTKAAGGEGDAQGSKAQQRAECDAAPTGDSAFGRLAPLFLALALLELVAILAAFLWYSKKRWARSEAAVKHMVWRRQLEEAGSEPVLSEDGGEPDGLEINEKPNALL